MFKRVCIYILLFNFLNTIFFVGETVDSTPFDGTEEVTEEINSVVEFVVEDCMHIGDTTPDDEDDDMADPFQAEKTIDLHPISLFEFRVTVFLGNITHSYPLSSSHYSGFLEILSPPPKLA
jgi:hypothetical protein